MLMIVLLALLTTVRAQCQNSNSLSWSHPPKFIDGINGTVIYNGLNVPRGLRYDGAGHLLVVETDKGVIALSENSDGCSGWTKKVLVDDRTLNHGVIVSGTALYASGPDYVYYWTYDPQALTVSNKQMVVKSPSGNQSSPS
jgi:glucose/arabinose dehydrogenase